MPAIPQALGLPEGSEYYGLFFGYPAVDYHRSVHREGTSPVRRLGMI